MKKKLETQIETMVKPRSPRPTVQCVDTYCELYRDLFIEVRAYESFKYLQLGLISDLKRKSLPAISKRSAAPSGGNGGSNKSGAGMGGVFFQGLST